MVTDEGLAGRRKREKRRYHLAYLNKDYRMGPERFRLMRDVVRELGPGDSFLDVGCGRGELLEVAKEAGFKRVVGAEVVEYLCHPGVEYIDGIHDLPFKDSSFEVVMCCDVLEHLLEQDARSGICELMRVARSMIILTVSWFPSSHGSFDGRELHILRKHPSWWGELIFEHKPKALEVTPGWRKSSALITVNI